MPKRRTAREQITHRLHRMRMREAAVTLWTCPHCAVQLEEFLAKVHMASPQRG